MLNYNQLSGSGVSAGAGLCADEPAWEEVDSCVGFFRTFIG